MTNFQDEPVTEGLAPSQIRALDLLRRSRRVLLVGHVRPDGDCLGSQAALARVLEALGREARVVNPDLPDPRYAYLTAEGRFAVYQEGVPLPEHDLAVLLDFCELSRTGPMAEPLERAASRKLVVDHHVHEGEAWWDEAFVDPHASATGLLVWRMAQALDVPLDPQAARGVFTSIVSDTGWFKYGNTDAETLQAASRMVELGAEPNRIHAALHQSRPRSYPHFLGTILSRAEFLLDGRLVVVDLPRDAAQEGGDSDEALDILRSVGTVEVVLFLREMADGTSKLSARSKTAFDVHALARAFGGGGHRKAAGATLAMKLPEARARVVEAARAALAAEPVASPEGRRG